MTKREHEKYNKEVYDKYGNRLNIGDTVCYSVCSSHVDLATVHHFCNKTVCIIDLSGKFFGEYRDPRRLIKVTYTEDKK